MSIKQHKLLLNFNRALILGLAVAGLLMDGYQCADVPAILALFVWLWLAVCTRMEAKVLNGAFRHCATIRFFGSRPRGRSSLRAAR